MGYGISLYSAGKSLVLGTGVYGMWSIQTRPKGSFPEYRTKLSWIAFVFKCTRLLTLDDLNSTNLRCGYYFCFLVNFTAKRKEENNVEVFTMNHALLQ